MNFGNFNNPKYLGPFGINFSLGIWKVEWDNILNSLKVEERALCANAFIYNMNFNELLFKNGNVTFGV